MKFLTMLAGLLGLASVPQKDNKVDLSDELKTKIDGLLGPAEASTLVEQANLELAGVADAQTQLREVQGQLATTTQQATAANAQVQTLTQELANSQQVIAQLADSPETIVETLNSVTPNFGAGKIIAVAGFLMGMQGAVFAMDRPWNTRIVAGMSAPQTDFKNDLVINTLNEDIKGFVAEYPTKFETLFEKKYNLPDLWKQNTIFGVADRLVSAIISVEEVTQPRKAVWVAKGGVTIHPEVMEVRPTQIDLQFNYWKLQALETSWMHQFNREGSQAYKMSFIEFLIVKYLEKARSEDADVLVRGVFSEKPADYDKPVTYLIRNNGVFKQLFDARDITHKFRPYYLGELTEQNVCDYVDAAIQALPPDVRNMDLQFDWSPYWIKKYQTRDREIYGGNNDYTGLVKHPRDYPNIEFVPVVQMEGSKFFFITFKDNVKPLEFKPEEKSKLTFERFLRDVYAFADYKLGIGINHIGLETADDNPLKYELQAVWSNTEPLFDKNFFIPVFDFGNGVVNANHNRIAPTPDFTTNITSIKGNVGRYLFIRGNISMVGNTLVKKNAELVLGSDFDLKSGGTLTLIKVGATWKEISRTDAPETVSNQIDFTDATIDYADSDKFIYKGAAAVDLAEIKGGSEGNTIRIFGGEAAGSALTVKDAGNINVNSDYVMDAHAKWIDLIFINGTWVEVERG
ncbi:hypothetical protein [Chryseobacterium vrystaatense]|uniref:Uncharacterized protein n=1 Tax=Chryseobacterium vrystaatense TaxID=307480 RepID=A0ABR4UJ54_9FLAO|nr:hypothetical protein [Chryseobacterium vrystaatense]KFF24755.1 hypothetical protein IW16_17625 [Chryseobacterium vrystaatense]